MRYLLSPKQARALLKSTGVSHRVIREILGINKSTLWRYFNGELTFPRDTQIAIWCICHNEALRQQAILGEPLSAAPLMDLEEQKE